MSSELQQPVSEVSVDDAIIDYLMRIVAATRASEMLDLGVSPRGTLSLFRAAQALALAEERSVLPAGRYQAFGHPCLCSPHSGQLALFLGHAPQRRSRSCAPRNHEDN